MYFILSFSLTLYFRSFNQNIMHRPYMHTVKQKEKEIMTKKNKPTTQNRTVYIHMCICVSDIYMTWGKFVQMLNKLVSILYCASSTYDVHLCLKNRYHCICTMMIQLSFGVSHVWCFALCPVTRLQQIQADRINWKIQWHSQDRIQWNW